MSSGFLFDDLDDRPKLYPFSAGWQGTDTSKQAAESIDAASLRAGVLQYLLRWGPRTADEIAHGLQIDKLAIRPRCSELKALGKIEDSGERRANQSGKTAAVWRIA